MTNYEGDPVVKHTEFNVLDEFQTLETAQVKAIADERALPYAVALANVTGDLNIGFVIRTSAVFSAEKVYIFGRRKWDRRSAVGSNCYIDVEAYHNDTDPFDWENMLQTIRINGYIPIIVEQCGTSVETMDKLVASDEKICLVFGPESGGIPIDVCEQNLCVGINQYGVIRSLNVSSAAAIVIHKLANLLHK